MWSAPYGLGMSVLDLMGVVPRDDEAGLGFQHGGLPHASHDGRLSVTLSTTSGHPFGGVSVWSSLLGL